MKSTKVCIFHNWGCVSPHVWRASWPLAPRLVVTLPQNTSNILGDVILRLGLNACDAGTVCLKFGKKKSISNNVYVIGMLYMNENLYINSSSMLTFSIGNLFRWLLSPHIHSTCLLKMQMKILCNPFKNILLTNWGRDQMDISQTIYSNAFS